LSQNQPREDDPGRLSLDVIQNTLLDAYLEALFSKGKVTAAM
jgi:hypothetical protein